MEISLREAGDDERDAVRASVATLLPGLPEATLLALLDRRKAGAEADELEVPRLAAQHLARVVSERKDMHLAQKVLATAGPLLGDQGDAVAKLAQGGGAARVDARTVGLLLSSRDDESRRRSAEVAAGLANGLGLPGSPARLATREDGGSAQTITEALSGLSADGAAIIVAGLNPEQAKVATEFAQAESTPILLLRPAEVGQPAGSRFAFALGDDPSRTADILQAAFVGRGMAAVAVVGESEELNKNVQATKFQTACDAVLPLAEWRTAGVGGVVLNGGRDCVESSLKAMSLTGFRPAVAFAMEIPTGKSTGAGFDATAGLFPIDGNTTNPAVRAWITRRGDPPSWWAGLGHDAGVLAWAGVRDLPPKGTEDRKEVAARRAAATEALAHATGELWTTEAHGFDGGRVLPRKIGVKDR